MRQLLASEIFNSYKKKGFIINNKPFSMNVFGIRTSNDQSNTFNDCVGVFWNDGKQWNIRQYDATTDAGTFYRNSPMNVNGTAIMVPGQYEDVYKIGLHNGYEALQQIAPIKYVRDNTKSGILHWYYKLTGQKYFIEQAQTDIHHAAATYKSGTVDKWSAGCQVLADPNDFAEFLNYCKESVNMYKFPNLFSYTLFESIDM